jgi:hypothetical protein
MGTEMGTKGAVRRPLDKLRLKAKARQAEKLGAIRDALTSAGFDTTTKQAVALGVGRSTAWAFLNRDRRTGPSAVVIKRILSSPNLPPAVRRRLDEYVEEKIAGVYGHSEARRRWLRDQTWIPRGREQKHAHPAEQRLPL